MKINMRRVISFLIVLFLVSTFNITTSDAQDSAVYMYWANNGANKIQRANLDGTNVQDIITVGLEGPEGIAVDVVGGKMYWTDHDTNRIQRANLDGSNIEDLVTGLELPLGIALDVAGGKMYWTEYSRFIQRANLDGTNVEVLIATGLSGAEEIALDVAGGKMYWTDDVADRIQRANLDGTNVEVLVTTGLRSPEGIALDVAGGKMYWADHGARKIQRANLDGTNVEDIVTTLLGANGLALDVAAGKVYWTDSSSGRIQRANLNGTNIETLVTGLGPPQHWLEGIEIGIPQTGAELRFSPNFIADQYVTVNIPVDVTLPIAVGGTAPYTYSISALPAGLYFDTGARQIRGIPTTVGHAHPVTYTVTDATGQTASLNFTITVQTTHGTNVYMYWTNSTARKIQRANLDGTNIQDLVTTGLVAPESIALDIAAGKMYWTDTGADRIQRANLDGTNVEDIPIPGVAAPEGIALDLAAGKIYWSDNGTDKIRRANLDGANPEDLVTGVDYPEGIALDLAAGKIYWANYTQARIRRANLDGTNIEDVVTTGLDRPDGLAIDTIRGKLYWTDHGTVKIRRVNLDGTNPEDLVTANAGLVVPDGIALDVVGGKMYWTDHNGKIQRANLDGSNVELLVTTEDALKRIALSIPQVSPGAGLRFSPSDVADQTFTVGTYASLNLPIATGGTEPYSYTLTPNLPAGLQFDAFDRWIGGTPTTSMPPTPYTYTAMDTTGASASLTFTIEVTGTGTSNLDVNGDGQVTVIDLAIVALFYGTRVPVGVSLPADVNTDGVVDILDLTAVAQGIDAAGGGLNQLSLWEVEAALLAAVDQVAEIGAVAGAPMGFGTGQHALANGIAYGNVAAALSDARQMTVGDVRLGKGLAVLEGLLQLLAEMGAIPETTALLPNYPNPFNPETWLPYQLAKAADVTLTVYDMRGVAVRQLVLGHQPAGVYQSRGRAAYWDGKNDFGEPVASGVYFYTLTAGEFTATRKLLIRK